MHRKILWLGAAMVMVALLLAACDAGGPSGRGGATATTASTTPTTGATTARPADNGIAAKPIRAILAASERALRSARSVRVALTARDREGLIRVNFKLTSDHRAAGWIEQGGVRVDIIATGGKFYLRSRKLWEQQGNAEMAKLIGDRWVLAPRSAVAELTPFSSDLSIGGIASLVFSSKDLPRFTRKTTATLAGRPAVRLRASDGSYYVAATGKPYPLLLEHAGDDQDIAFSEYNANPVISAPRGALDLDKLRG